MKKQTNKKKLKKRKKTNLKSKKKLRIRYGRILICFLFLLLIIYLVISLTKIPIKNIYIYNNSLLSDQEIIDLAGIKDYPSIFSKTTKQIKKQLEKNMYIKKAIVRKKHFKEIHIKIEENYILFYNSSKGVTILKDNSEIDQILDGPYLVNYITDNIYDEFVKKMRLINRDIIDRISEIKYDPNSVDNERFLFTMNDGNYVYLTLMYFSKINNYVDILKNFENKKGILYLDSGEYFKVLE